MWRKRTLDIGLAIVLEPNISHAPSPDHHSTALFHHTKDKKICFHFHFMCGRIAFPTLFSVGRGKFCNPMRHRGRLCLTEVG